MEETQYNKLLWDIPKPDVVITMGCNVTCPCVPGQYTEDWGLEDPTGKEDEEFLKVINSIEEKVRKLKETREGYLQLDIDMLIKQDIFYVFGRKNFEKE